MMRHSIVLMAVLIGCAPRGEPTDSIPLPEAAAERGEALIGFVRIVGSAPVNVQVVLQPEEGRSVRLVGPLVSELERLSGVLVAVRGEIRESADPIVDREIEATGYEILGVDGQPVVTGEITSISGGTAVLRTEAGHEIVLPAPPGELRVGQKVWVQGPQSLSVQSYGIIRP
ncbi:MAG: hypothetical protein WD766_10410 [Gemmatimonadota bacterium]